MVLSIFHWHLLEPDLYGTKGELNHMKSTQPSGGDCKEEMLNESYLEVWKEIQDILRKSDIGEIGTDLRTTLKAAGVFPSGLRDSL